jgi:hypothetical protein
LASATLVTLRAGDFFRAVDEKDETALPKLALLHSIPLPPVL